MSYEQNTFDELYDRGLTALMKGELETAERFLSQSLKLSPDSHLARYQLGRCLLRSGNLQKSQELLEQAIHLQPEHIPSLTDLGFTYLCQNRIKDAYNIFQKAIALRPHHGKSLLGLAICDFSEGKWDSAYDWANQSVKLGGSHFMALFMLAKTEKVLGFLEQAEEHFKKAEELLEKTTEVAPEQPESYYIRGEISLLGEFYNKALELFRKVESQIDKNRTYYFYHEWFNIITVWNKQGICLKQLGKKEEAHEIGKKILERDPNNKFGKLLTEI